MGVGRVVLMLTGLSCGENMKFFLVGPDGDLLGSGPGVGSGQ